MAETGLSAAFIRTKIMNDAMKAAKMVLTHISNFLTLLIQILDIIHYTVLTVVITPDLPIYLIMWLIASNTRLSSNGLMIKSFAPASTASITSFS